MKRLKEIMLKANKNYKHEIIFISLFDFIVFVVALILLSWNVILSVNLLVTLFLYNVYYFTRYQRIIYKNNNNLILEFIDTFSYFRIYISNNMNVYQAFEQIKNYASPFIKFKIETLINEIDEDTSLKPYINFAKNFNDEKVEEVMIAIYEMVNEGNNETYLNQFINIFTSFKTRIEKDQYEKRLNKFNLINQISLVGSGILMISVMFGIVSMLGEFIK